MIQHTPRLRPSARLEIALWLALAAFDGAVSALTGVDVFLFFACLFPYFALARWGVEFWAYRPGIG
jgi:hypothetical protein